MLVYRGVEITINFHLDEEFPDEPSLLPVRVHFSHRS